MFYFCGNHTFFSGFHNVSGVAMFRVPLSLQPPRYTPHTFRSVAVAASRTSQRSRSFTTKQGLSLSRAEKSHFNANSICTWLEFPHLNIRIQFKNFLHSHKFNSLILIFRKHKNWTDIKTTFFRG